MKLQICILKELNGPNQWDSPSPDENLKMRRTLAELFLCGQEKPTMLPKFMIRYSPLWFVVFPMQQAVAIMCQSSGPPKFHEPWNIREVHQTRYFWGINFWKVKQRHLSTLESFPLSVSYEFCLCHTWRVEAGAHHIIKMQPCNHQHYYRRNFTFWGFACDTRGVSAAG